MNSLPERAVAANGSARGLIGKHERTFAEEEAMIAAALESLRLWRVAGTVVNEQRGCWLARAAVDA